jgi:uncharacterized repeat protein (TIGR01451 family)
LLCDRDAVDFEDGIPGYWNVYQVPPEGPYWTTTDSSACGIDNRTNGSGEALCVDRDRLGAGSYAYSTVIMSNRFSLSRYTEIKLKFTAYYRRGTADDKFRLLVSNDDGVTWGDPSNPFHVWNSSINPGDDFEFDLAAYAGYPQVKIAFDYRGTEWNWFAQVDDIELVCTGPDLSMTASVAPASVVEGDPVTYTFNLTNHGPGTAKEVNFHKFLPGNSDYVASTVSQGTREYNPANHVWEAELGEMLEGENAVVTLTLIPYILRDAGLRVNSPVSIAGIYQAGRGDFSPPIPFEGITGDVVLVDDGRGDNHHDGCSEWENADAVRGNIALIDEGDCDFSSQFSQGEFAEPAAVIVASIEGDDLINMDEWEFGTPLPSLYIGRTDSLSIRSRLEEGVNVTLFGYMPDRQDFSLKMGVSASTYDPERDNDTTVSVVEILNDSDGDGQPEISDNCPNDFNPDQKDTDGDKAGDLCDTCTDTDGDGSGDPGFSENTCPTDNCPSDSGKTDPGVCGCGTADIDSNSNNIADCLAAQDLQSQMSGLDGQLRKLKPLGKRASRRKKNRQRQIKNGIKDMLTALSSFARAAAGKIVLNNTTKDLNTLIRTMAKAVRKALRTNNPKFRSNKKKARRRVKNLSRKLS